MGVGRNHSTCGWPSFSQPCVEMEAGVFQFQVSPDNACGYGCGCSRLQSGY